MINIDKMFVPGKVERRLIMILHLPIFLPRDDTHPLISLSRALHREYVSQSLDVMY